MLVNELGATDGKKSEVRHRVLQDLSFASLGFSGIPQDTRLMFKTFASMDSVEVTGLLGEMSGGYSRDISTASTESSEDKFLSASLFMLAASGRPVRRTPSGYVGRVMNRFERMAALFKRFKACDVPAAFYDGVIWRNYFQRTLSSGDRKLIAEQAFKFTNLNSSVLNDRMQAPVFWSPRLDTKGFDFMVTSDPRPIQVSPGTSLIVRYHDAIPLTQPDTMDNPDAVRLHFQAVERTRRHGWFVCNSQSTEKELLDIFPSLAGRTFTIPYVLPSGGSGSPAMIDVGEIIRSRLSSACLASDDHPSLLLNAILRRSGIDKPFRYIMWLTSIEPKKNLVAVVRAWERVKYVQAPDLKLIIVGKPAWRYEDLLNAVRPRFLEGELIHLEDLPFVEIQTLYRNAECFVFPSYAEGFGFPPMEAMDCGTPSVVSDIPAHRWVMEDSVLYADPYDDRQLADQIRRLICSDDRAEIRARLLERGKIVRQRYSLENVTRQWECLFSHLKSGGRLPLHA